MAIHKEQKAPRLNVSRRLNDYTGFHMVFRFNSHQGVSFLGA